ncbi:MAG: hypothetical protein ACIARR_10635 [Phycisphaerales bacterium JB059]
MAVEGEGVIRDDRGRRIPLRTRGGVIAVRVRGFDGVRRRHVYELRWMSVELAVVALLVGAGLFLAPGPGWASQTLAMVMRLGGTLILALGALVLVSVLIVRWRSETMGEPLTRARAERGRCRGCAFELEGVEAEPDGCVVCPECGGAWRLAARPAIRSVGGGT